MASEKQWVEGLVERLESDLQVVSVGSTRVRVAAHRKLPYQQEVVAYEGDEPVTVRAKYETDLLVYDETEGDRWIPRVVIEGKLKQVTTHDALTYSAKASTHKQVHPYLRHGILIGDWGDYGFPTRLYRHGAYFDFMGMWRAAAPSDAEWYGFIEVLTAEVKTSRQIQELLVSSRSRSRTRYSLVHRPLVIS